MSNFKMTQSLGEIVAEIPLAADVFRTYKIDFCCGDHRTLAAALQEQGLDEQTVLKQQDAAYDQAQKLTGQVDFRDIPPSVFGKIKIYQSGS